MSTKISNEFTEILKKFYVINSNIKLCKDTSVLKSKNAANTMMVKANVEERFERDFNIYDVREFLSVLSLIDEPVLDLSHENYALIKSLDGKQKIRYLDTPDELITSYTDKEPTFTTAHFEIEIDAVTFKRVVQSSNTLKLEYIGFHCEGGNVTLKAFNKNRGDEIETNYYSVDVGKASNDFQLNYKLDVNRVQVVADEGALLFRIDAKRKISNILTETGKDFFLSLEPKSTFNFDGV